MTDEQHADPVDVGVGPPALAALGEVDVIDINLARRDEWDALSFRFVHWITPETFAALPSITSLYRERELSNGIVGVQIQLAVANAPFAVAAVALEELRQALSLQHFAVHTATDPEGRFVTITARLDPRSAPPAADPPATPPST